MGGIPTYYAWLSYRKCTRHKTLPERERRLQFQMSFPLARSEIQLWVVCNYRGVCLRPHEGFCDFSETILLSKFTAKYPAKGTGDQELYDTDGMGDVFVEMERHL